jgi:dTDP-4-amino-4,6-dideoxygalactose transaminase
MSEAAAIVGRSQLKKLSSMNFQREELSKRYIQGLANVAGITAPTLPTDGVSSWHFFVIKVGCGFSLTRDELYKALGEKGVQCNVHYTPLYKFKPFLVEEHQQCNLFPNSEQCYEQALSLPLYPTMTWAMVDYVCEVIRELGNEKG